MDDGRKDYAELKEIFCAARELSGPARAEFLDDACRDDPAAREHVQRLLAADDSDDGWLEAGPFGESGTPPAARDFGESELPGEIGSYRILGRLGEGGMGVVFRAQQQKPRRAVALKVLRAGLVDAQVLRRFEHEAEILGRLHHPGIAQVYEAGTATVAGVTQPFFALELVEGLPLSDHADRAQLGLEQRLELLCAVCDAVHHAHQKSVVHRDLKPANILVDESGQVKILDFGIARVTDVDARVTAMRTASGMVVGTLSYMSPEQAQGGAASIDARADVYALGVIGFELLAGCLPQDFDDTSFHAAVRRIVEEEPLRLGAVRAKYRGDLETIFTKALEKSPDRRYASAAALAADLRRFARNEPIAARPPSAVYQLGKLARRHRGIVAGLAMAFVTLIVGLVVSLALYQEAERAREGLAVEAAAAIREANKARSIQEFLLQDMLASPNPWEERGDIMVSEVLDAAGERVGERFEDAPAVEAEVRSTLGGSYLARGLYARADPHLARSLELHRELRRARLATDGDLAQRLLEYGTLKWHVAEFPASVELCREALAMRRRLHGQGPEVAAVLLVLGRSLAQDGQYDEARDVLEECLAMRESLAGGDSIEVADALGELGALEFYTQDFAASIDTYERALEIERRLLGDSSPFVAATMNALAQAVIAADPVGGAPRSIDLMRAAADILERALGTDHRVTLQTSRNLGIALGKIGEMEEAEALLRDAHERSDEVLGPRHIDALQASNALAELLITLGEQAEAMELYTAAVPIAREVLGPEHPDTLTAVFNLGWVLRKTGDLEGATDMFREAADGFARLHGADTRAALLTRKDLALVLVARAEHRQAAEVLRELVALRESFEGLANPRSDLARACSLLGTALLEADDFEGAREFLEVAHELCSDLWGEADWRAADADSKLGAALAGLGRTELAEEHLIRAFERLREAGAPKELEAAEARLTAFYEAREAE